MKGVPIGNQTWNSFALQFYRNPSEILSVSSLYSILRRATTSSKSVTRAYLRV